MALKGRKKELSAALSPHPGDARIAETNSRRSFENVRLRGEFRGAVLHRYNDPKRSPLHRAFEKIYYDEQVTIYLNNTFDVTVNEKGSVTFKNFPFSYDEVHDEFVAMARTFHRITGMTDLEFLIFENLKTEPDHDHDYPVMNCTWLHDGSVWKNEEGVQQQVAEGNWFFFEPGFRHNSPEPRGGRFTILVKPKTRSEPFVGPIPENITA